ncbi:MAG: signal recognition particle-docking protein FtsY [Erysipelotrichaceae bacterium]|jgi:fused signal recognition particle receptor|nr:signal recognition particle-docking protein FtsY [Erysipelotrichaceae bacterium]
MGFFSRLFKRGVKKDDAQKEYDLALKKAKKSFTDKLTRLASLYKKVNQEYFEKLEEILIEADVGVTLTYEIIEALLLEAKQQKIEDATTINTLLIDKLFVSYASKGDIDNRIKYYPDGPSVILIVGVNGSGKTTSIAKLAHLEQSKGKRILLVAGDTFRAGAVEQLQIWAKRLELPIVTGKENADPSSVIYEGILKAKQEHFDLVIIDTSGRLQTKMNLMLELQKITRVIKKEIITPIETFLVLDATTGQNGISQAKAFYDVSAVTGIIITKLDSTSKGGIILSIRNELNLPVRFIGLGEKLTDLKEFDLDKYLSALLVGEDE